ncbi:MAG TPA: outer membrane protein assembly factor BamA [Candidatus Babeliales bacterium]|nr:outer membrane protein assembly factor BamA [Candidatus Babeliales bacterium]HLC07338.1 outer membrane protein assembly factor BamA [Candidatus Babeliales bacterium]
MVSLILHNYCIKSKQRRAAGSPMTEKVKKGNRNHCVTVLFLLLLSGITQSQQVIDSNTSIDIQEVQPYDKEHNEDGQDFEQDEQDDDEENDDGTAQQQSVSKTRRINAIKIHGNISTSKDAIINHIPYKIGEIFDPRKTGTLIRNLYYNLKKFRTVKVMGEVIDNNYINLHVFVEEKYPLKELKTVGNKKVSEKEIGKKINLEDITSVDPEELKIIANKIKDIYLEKGYHQTEIDTELLIDDNNRGTAVLTVHEGIAATVKQIHFIGNKSISSKDLRAVALTKEDWLLGFLDKSGNYHPDRLEGDKHFIEQYYQNSGFLHAKVVNIDIDIDPETQNIILTFEIEEGDRYVIDKISAPGTDTVPEQYLLAMLPIRPGMYYSRDGITNSIKRLELIWGDYGYIFAHIEPSIQPNEDEKTVSLSFFSELGDQVYLNKINIRGNTKTRDKIIRRKILLDEGELLTQNRMNASKRNVASLGYFDPREGVNWKIRRLNKEEADLDLILKETKTGHFGAQLGFGGSGADWQSPISGMSVKAELSDTNLFGSGVHLNLSTTYSKDEQTAMLHVAQPWLFDKPLLGAFDIYHRRPVYDELRHVKTVHQKLTGGSITFGCITQSKNQLFHDVNILFSSGVEDIKYDRPAIALLENPLERAQYQHILDQEFRPGTFAFVSTKMEQDTRNHPIHTMYGHRWKFATKFAIPTFGNNIGFYKIELDASWFTPLIAEYDLIFRIHGYFGISAPFKNRTVPFGDLFHIGGQTSVRGFLFGQIGPQFLGDTIGGAKAFFWNAELVAPITADMNMKAVVFYDGGTGFDNPYVTNADKKFVTGNNFDYRHSIGVGIRLLQPMPVNIDWGFKIDPRKNKLFPNRSESASEIHFGMSYDW